MVQRMHRMICEVDPNASVSIATSENQVISIRCQLGAAVGISIEPCRRDTFPAIALATAYLHEVAGIPAEETVVVCPVDPYVEQDYFRMLNALSVQAAKGEAKLVFMGIEPTYPSTKDGYIILCTGEDTSAVDTFEEKPDETTAALPIPNFEDALQRVCASRLKADFIITRNLKDFKNSKVMAIKPTELIERVTE